MDVPRLNIKKIPEIMLCRILMFIWSFGALSKAPRLLLARSSGKGRGRAGDRSVVLLLGHFWREQDPAAQATSLLKGLWEEPLASQVHTGI